MQEQQEISDHVENICLDDALLVAMASNVGFACTLSIKCVHGHHQFTIELLHVPSAANTMFVTTTQVDKDTSEKLNSLGQTQTVCSTIQTMMRA